MDANPNVTPASEVARPSPRYHDLDALRAAAMLLGIVLHAALFLVPDAWPVLDKKASASLPYDDIVNVIHGFRMPVFFLLSGFFTAMLWQRRGLGGVLRQQRLQRVGLPLLVGCFTIVPLTTWVWLVVTDYNIAKDFPAETPVLVMAAFVWLFSWFESFHHLWFLWHLLWLVGLFALSVRLGVTFTHRWAWWALVPLTLLAQFTMKWFGADTSTGLIIATNVLGYYATLLPLRRVSLPARRHRAEVVGRRPPSDAAGPLPPRYVPASLGGEGIRRQATRTRWARSGRWGLWCRWRTRG